MHIGQLFHLVVAVVMSPCVFASAEELTHPLSALSLPAEEIEVLQADATLKLNTGDIKTAIEELRRIIDGSVITSKAQIDALELLALSFKQMKDDSAAAGVYRRLITTGPKDKIPAYSFELGTIRLKQKNYKEAKKLLEVAHDGAFNTGSAKFFLGVIAMQESDFRHALYYFSSALKESDAEQLLPAIRYNLAMAQLQLGKAESSMNGLRVVSEHDPKDSQDAIAANSSKGARKTIDAMKPPRWMGQFSFAEQTDSNVQSNPTKNNPTPAEVANQQTTKEILSGTITWVSPGMRTWQFAPSYSLYGNFNNNVDTRDYDFFTHTLIVTALYKPWERFSKGFKASSTYSTKNTGVQGHRGSTRYTKYSLTEEVGPTFKYELSPRAFLSGDMSWKPQTYYNDPSKGPNRRSSLAAAGAHFGYDFISSSMWWAPSATLILDWTDTAGTTYDYFAYCLELSNKIQASQKLSFTLTGDALFTKYGNAKPVRNDKYYSGRVALNYAANAKWSLIADATYMFNDSNQARLFKYKRFVASGGVTYTF